MVDFRDFVNKVAFVTGGASGIGRATCELLGARGARIAVIDVREAVAKQVAQELSTTYSTKWIGVCCDVSNYDQVEVAVKQTVKELGGLHVALNAAGLPAWIGDGVKLGDYPVESWDKIMAVNCNGVFYCCMAQINQFLADKTKGAIVKISSCAGKRSTWLASAYVTSKHAVIGITQSASLEYARYGIRTNAIAPGYTETPMLALAGETGDAEYIQQTPMGRVGKPSEIGELIVFLLSEKASYISGGLYPVDGGWLNSPLVRPRGARRSVQTPHDKPRSYPK